MRESTDIAHKPIRSSYFPFQRIYCQAPRYGTSEMQHLSELWNEIFNAKYLEIRIESGKSFENIEDINESLIYERMIT